MVGGGGVVVMEERGEWTFVLSRWVRWEGGRDVLYVYLRKI